MNKQILEIEIKRYFTISIKKLLTTNKERIGVIDIEQNKIRNNINNLQSDGLEYSEEIEKLNKKFLDLELQKPNIDWDTLSYKCTQQMKDRYKEFNVDIIIKLIEKTKNIFIKNNYSLESFRRYNNISRRKSYKKSKDLKGEEMLSNKEKALKTAQIKREKSFNLVNDAYAKLIKLNKKPTCQNIEIMINSQVKKSMIANYLKEIKTNQGEK